MVLGVFCVIVWQGGGASRHRKLRRRAEGPSRRRHPHVHAKELPVPYRALHRVGEVSCRILPYGRDWLVYFFTWLIWLVFLLMWLMFSVVRLLIIDLVVFSLLLIWVLVLLLDLVLLLRMWRLYRVFWFDDAHFRFLRGLSATLRGMSGSWSLPVRRAVKVKVNPSVDRAITQPINRPTASIKQPIINQETSQSIR